MISHQGKQNKSTVRYYYKLTVMTIIKKTDNTTIVGEPAEFSTHCWWKYKNTQENHLPVSYDVKSVSIPWFSNSTPGYFLREMKIYIHTQKVSTWMLKAVLFLTDPKLETMQMSINRKVDDWTMIYSFNGNYSEWKKEQLLILATKEQISKNMLSEISQPQNSTCMVVLTLILKMGKTNLYRWKPINAVVWLRRAWVHQEGAGWWNSFYFSRVEFT